MNLDYRLKGKTQKPTIIANSGSNPYVIVGSMDHGLEIPEDSVMGLISSLNGVTALMMEVPEEFHYALSPMSTELLVKASVGNVPVHYLPGNGSHEDIGGHVLKYAPRDMAELFVPCVYVRNTLQSGQDISPVPIIRFATAYQERFGFLDVQRALGNYLKVIRWWEKNNLDTRDLDHFSYDFEKFTGDVREFELWTPELTEFRKRYPGKIAVCCGDYHVPFAQSVFDGREQKQPDWKAHIDNRREDRTTPQDADFLKKVYENIGKALKS